MILAAHQPNFLPWLPYFQKIHNCDLFILLGDVQYVRHQYQNRFFYENSWQTMSVNKGQLTDLISAKKYVNFEADWLKIKKRIRKPQLEYFDDLINADLFTSNRSIIIRAAELLSISTKIEIDPLGSEYDANSRLIGLCKLYGASTYLAGPSGKKYLDERLFAANKIKIVYQDNHSSQKIHILDIIQ